MNDWLDDSGRWRQGCAGAPIRAALLVSLVLHAAALWHWLPRLHLPSLDVKEAGEPGALVVELAPPPAMPNALPAPHVLTVPREHAPPATHAPRRHAPAPPPDVMALSRPAPAPAAPRETTPPPVPSPPASSPAGGDLAAYIEARRRGRNEATAPAPSAAGAPGGENDSARNDRIVASNLGMQRKMTFGYDPTRGGGMFQITHLSEDSAEFIFFGWEKEIRRNTKQYIEVRKGANSDIRWAVIRKMIAIIRDYGQEDFVWESWRLGKFVSLSARPRDNAELEGFLMLEFFPDARLAR
jgi:hypothetical protein